VCGVVIIDKAPAPASEPGIAGIEELLGGLAVA